MAPTARHHRRPLQRSAGFTLIELMIAVIVIGILIAVAYPTFIDSIRKGRRSEAFTAIAQVQQAQERWRSNNPAYNTTSLALLAVTSPTAPGGYYTLEVATNPGGDAVGYDVTATAVTGKSQVNDSTCAKLSVRVIRGSVTYASCTGCSTMTYGTGDNCWKR
jgi:type IV pilus assembly protein PilE